MRCTEKRLTVVALILVSGLPAVGHVQDVRQAEIAVDNPRPVAEAVRVLATRYPNVVITYEDPPFAYVDDIKDITLEVRKDLNLYRPGQAPKVLVPLGGQLAFSYLVAASGVPMDLGATLTALFEANDASARGGRFRVEQSATRLHVVPWQIRDSTGNWTNTASILTQHIDIPASEMTGVEMAAAIAGAVSAKIKGRVDFGIAPWSLLANHHGTLEAVDEPARDVLERVLDDVSPGFTWRLLYDPSGRAYFFNITRVQNRAANDSPDLPPQPTSIDPFVGRGAGP